MKIFFGILLAVFLTVGCATTAVEIKPFDNSITVESSFDDVWTSLIRFMSTNAIGIGSLEKASGLIVLSGDNLDPDLIRQYCDAKPPFMYAMTGGTAGGSVVVAEDEGFVTVTVNTKFQATSMYSMVNPPTMSTKSCNSTGAFETAVLGSIDR